MALDLDKALGIHAQALVLRARRAEVLAANLANADTPGYKARDLDFRNALARAREGADGAALRVTHPRHLGGAEPPGGELLYRLPLQPSVDGNTVDSQVEKAAFMENAVQYQATLSFLGGRFKGLLTAIKGE